MTKTLSADNFLLPDPLTGALVRREADGSERHRSAVDWAHEIHAFTLESTVPEGVRHRFEVARGILTFGFFWYPLWTHGAVEAVRSVEGAVEAVCETRGAPKKAKDAGARMAWLLKRRVLEVSDVEWWSTLAPLTAVAEAPDPPGQLAPARALETLAWAADLINRLFSASGPESGE